LGTTTKTPSTISTRHIEANVTTQEENQNNQNSSDEVENLMLKMASFATKQLGRDVSKGGRKGEKGGGHQEKTFVVRPFEGSRFGSGVDTRYLQATWVWGA
jgi:hypothetical protein